MALDYLTDLKRRHGLNIVATNNSYGGITTFSQSLQDSIVRAAKQNILYIVAAGNTQGQNNDVTASYPTNTNTTDGAGYDAVVSVTGMNSSGSQGYAYGPTTVDLGAPAISVYSTYPGGTYATLSGTSMATPHVTGAVALYAAKYPNHSARQIRTALLASTTPTASMAGITVTGGRLNVDALLNTVAPPELSIVPSQIGLNEGQSGSTPFSFQVNRQGSSTGQTSVFWAVSGQGANPVDAADFSGLQLPTGSVSFFPGELTKTITIDVRADFIEEPHDEFAVTLSNPTDGATLGTASATSTIFNDDGAFTAFNPARITIPSIGSGIPLPSTVTIATDSNLSLASLELTLYNLTHGWPDDLDILLVGPTGAKSLLMSDVGGAFGISDSTITFSSLASLSLPNSNQLLNGTYRPTDFEAGDIFSNPATPTGPYLADLSVFNGTNPNGVWSLYVQDDSYSSSNGYIDDGWSLSIATGPIVSLSVSPNSVMEDGTTNLLYTFTRTGGTSSSLMVNYSVAGTATVGTDYTGITGTPATINFAAGSATATVTVDPTTDSSVEADETVVLTLLAGTDYPVGTSGGVLGTIANDDVVLAEITLAVSPASVTEDGTTNLVYTFTRTGSTAASLIVNYSVAGTATLGTDYTGIGSASATVTFAAGSATATVTVDPTADTTVEVDETVALTLAAGTGYTIGTTGAVVGTILNDDSTPPPSTPIALPRPTLITAVDLDGNNSPISGEGADKAFDGTLQASYTNLGGANSGIEFTYDLPTRLSSFLITTALDPVGRHPTSYQVYAFNSGAWQLLASGSLQIAAQPGVDSSPVVLPDLPFFTQYRVIFPTVRVSGSFMQIAELKLSGSQSSTPATQTVKPIDDVTGQVYQQVEGAGGVKLVKDVNQGYFAQIGNAAPVKIMHGGTQVYQGMFSEWEALGAESVGRDNYLTWVNLTGNYLQQWTLDGNWNFLSSQGQVGMNSLEGRAQESKFGQDFNGDGVIGRVIGA